MVISYLFLHCHSNWTSLTQIFITEVPTHLLDVISNVVPSSHTAVQRCHPETTNQSEVSIHTTWLKPTNQSTAFTPSDSNGQSEHTSCHTTLISHSHNTTNQNSYQYYRTELSLSPMKEATNSKAFLGLGWHTSIPFSRISLVSCSSTPARCRLFFDLRPDR